MKVSNIYQKVCFKRLKSEIRLGKSDLEMWIEIPTQDQLGHFHRPNKQNTTVNQRHCSRLNFFCDLVLNIEFSENSAV